MCIECGFDACAGELWLSLLQRDVGKESVLSLGFIPGALSFAPQLLVDHLLSEFPDVFGFPQVITTAAEGPTTVTRGIGRRSLPSGLRASDDMVPAVDILDPPPVRVSREEFDARHARGEFAIKYDDLFTHPLVTNSYGITQEALDEVGCGREGCSAAH